MTLLLFLWLGLFAVLLILLVRDPRRAGALTLSYFMALTLIHVPGALTYVAWPVGSEETLLGLETTVLGVAFFVAGVAAAQLFGNRAFNATAADLPLDTGWLNSIAHKFFGIGVLVFFVAIPIAAQLPSLTSVLSAFIGLLVIGVWLWLCAAIIDRDGRKQLLILSLLPLLPFATLTAIGFVSFSTQWILTILAFLFMMVRRRIGLILVMPFAFYLSLSLFVAYIGERNAIRDAIWYQEADLRTRFERIGDIFVNFEPLDLGDQKHAAALEARLNQNSLVGSAVTNIDAGTVPLAYGGTVPWWAFVPRVIWADKPEIGGGRSLVSDVTGLYFPEGTSVGAGQVLEFYVNFGTPGVVVGFLLFGFILMWFDRRIMLAMRQADMASLLRYSMVGLTLVNPGGNLLEMVIAAIGAFIASPLILYLDRKLRSLPVAVFARRVKV